jgi:hypothetical protein
MQLPLTNPYSHVLDIIVMADWRLAFLPEQGSDGHQSVR